MNTPTRPFPGYLCITIDVEAHPRRAPSDHVRRLIWGQFPAGDYGLRRLTEIAAAQGYRTTCFLDWPEHYLYGNEIEAVATFVVNSSHDLQVHAHIEHLPGDLLADFHLDSRRRLDQLNVDQADAIVAWLRDVHVRTTGEQPVAFRGGGYRYNAAVLTALAQHGFRISSNYNPSRAQFAHFGPMPPFRWENGLLELPVSGVPDGPDRFTMTNFNLRRLSDLDRLLNHADHIAAQIDSIPYMVLVLHSWSLFDKDPTGHYCFRSDAAAQRLDAFLRALRLRGWRSVTLSELPTMVDAPVLPLKLFPARATM